MSPLMDIIGSGLANNVKGMLTMDILNEDSECASRKKHDEMLNDPVFAGAEFFFPPCDNPEDEGCGEEFTEEGFRKAAREILSGDSALIGRNIGRSKPKTWRRKI